MNLDFNLPKKALILVALCAVLLIGAFVFYSTTQAAGLTKEVKINLAAIQESNTTLESVEYDSTLLNNVDLTSLGLSSSKATFAAAVACAPEWINNQCMQFRVTSVTKEGTNANFDCSATQVNAAQDEESCGLLFKESSDYLAKGRIPAARGRMVARRVIVPRGIVLESNILSRLAAARNVVPQYSVSYLQNENNICTGRVLINESNAQLDVIGGYNLTAEQEQTLVNSLNFSPVPGVNCTSQILSLVKEGEAAHIEPVNGEPNLLQVMGAHGQYAACNIFIQNQSETYYATFQATDQNCNAAPAPQVLTNVNLSIVTLPRADNHIVLNFSWLANLEVNSEARLLLPDGHAMDGVVLLGGFQNGDFRQISVDPAFLPSNLNATVRVCDHTGACIVNYTVFNLLDDGNDGVLSPAVGEAPREFLHLDYLNIHISHAQFQPDPVDGDRHIFRLGWNSNAEVNRSIKVYRLSDGVLEFESSNPARDVRQVDQFILPADLIPGNFNATIYGCTQDNQCILNYTVFHFSFDNGVPVVGPIVDAPIPPLEFNLTDINSTPNSITFGWNASAPNSYFIRLFEINTAAELDRVKQGNVQGINVLVRSSPVVNGVPELANQAPYTALFDGVTPHKLYLGKIDVCNPHFGCANSAFFVFTTNPSGLDFNSQQCPVRRINGICTASVKVSEDGYIPFNSFTPNNGLHPVNEHLKQFIQLTMAGQLDARCAERTFSLAYPGFEETNILFEIIFGALPPYVNNNGLYNITNTNVFDGVCNLRLDLYQSWQCLSYPTDDALCVNQPPLVDDGNGNQFPIEHAPDFNDPAAPHVPIVFTIDNVNVTSDGINVQHQVVLNMSWALSLDVDTNISMQISNITNGAVLAQADAPNFAHRSNAIFGISDDQIPGDFNVTLLLCTVHNECANAYYEFTLDANGNILPFVPFVPQGGQPIPPAPAAAPAPVNRGGGGPAVAHSGGNNYLLFPCEQTGQEPCPQDGGNQVYEPVQNQQVSQQPAQPKPVEVAEKEEAPIEKVETMPIDAQSILIAAILVIILTTGSLFAVLTRKK